MTLVARGLSSLMLKLMNIRSAKRWLGLSAIALCLAVLMYGHRPDPACAQCTDPAPINPCAPGVGSKVTDCQIEWRFTPMPVQLVDMTPTPDVRYRRFENGGPLETAQHERIICK